MPVTEQISSKFYLYEIKSHGHPFQRNFDCIILRTYPLACQEHMISDMGVFVHKLIILIILLASKYKAALHVML